jgi:hypothetical protein
VALLVLVVLVVQLLLHLVLPLNHIIQYQVQVKDIFLVVVEVVLD